MDDERFITEVQNRPILYDSSHRFYKDNTRKEKAWSEVGEAVGCNGECLIYDVCLNNVFLKYCSLPEYKLWVSYISCLN